MNQIASSSLFLPVLIAIPNCYIYAYSYSQLVVGDQPVGLRFNINNGGTRSNLPPKPFGFSDRMRHQRRSVLLKLEILRVSQEAILRIAYLKKGSAGRRASFQIIQLKTTRFLSLCKQLTVVSPVYKI